MNAVALSPTHSPLICNFPTTITLHRHPSFSSTVHLSKDRKKIGHSLGVTEKIQSSVMSKSMASPSLAPPLDSPGEDVSSQAIVSLHSSSKLCLYCSSMLKLLPLILSASIIKNLSSVKKEHGFLPAFNLVG
jgi:hypothetical protein